MESKQNFRRFWWPSHMSQQATLWVILLIISSSFLLAWHLSADLGEKAGKEVQRFGMAISQNIANQLVYPLSTGDIDGAQRELLAEAAYSQADEIFVYDEQGRLLIQVLAGGVATDFSQIDSVPLPSRSDINSVDVTQEGFSIWVPIGDHSAPLAWLNTRYKFEANALVREEMAKYFLESIIFLALAVWLTVIVLRRPVDAIEQATEFISQLDVSRGEKLPVKTGTIEIRHLYQALNHVSHKLHEQEYQMQVRRGRLARAACVAGVGMWDWDARERIFYWSNDKGELSQCQAHQLENAFEDELLSRVPSTDRDKVYGALFDVINGGSSISIDHQLLDTRGEVKVVQHQIEVIRDEEDNIVRLTGTILDVSERKNTELELKKKNRQILDILENTTDGYLSVDGDWKIEYINPQGRRMFNVDSETIEGESLWNLLGPLGESFKEGIKHAMQTAEVVELTSHCPVCQRWLEMRAHPKERGLTIYFRDVTDARLAVESLRASEEQIRTILDNVLDAIITLDAHGVIKTFNQAARNIFGYEADEVVGKSINILMPEETAASHSAYLRNYVASSEKPEFGNREFVAKRKDGTLFPVEIKITDMTVRGQVFLVGIIRDVTIRKQAEENMRLSEEVFANSLEGIVVADRKKHILRANYAFSNITGYVVSDFAGKGLDQILSDQTDPALNRSIWQAVDRRGQWKGEISGSRKNGEHYRAWVAVSMVKDSDDQVSHYIVVINDITEIKEAQSKIHQLVNFDALTGLPNRSLFTDRLAQGIAQADRSKSKLALLRVDLDRFKSFNDTIGHGSGDQLLRRVAERLSENVRQCDTVARLSGDEFAVMLTNLSTDNDAALVSRKILSVFEQPFEVDEHEVFVTASVGVARYPNDASNSDELMKRAGAAMHHVKEHGRNAYRFYTDDMDSSAFEHLVLENSLRRALERDEFVLFYQPQLDISTGRIIGVEALIRWQHPDLGMVSPAQFIPLLEETGLILSVGNWVLQTACRQAQLWADMGYESVRMAVNLSPRQIDQRNLVETVAEAIAMSGLDPHRLDLEITESCLMKDVKQSAQMLAELRRMEVTISIDDFGTGYSSLSYLTRFPVNTLKIDRSFVKDVTVDEGDASLAKAIISMAHSLQLKVLAEGVETPEQLEFLNQRRCDEVQGFLFSKPLPADEVVTLFDRDMRTLLCSNS